METAVCFEDVSFAYPNTEIPYLKNISFSVEKGECVLITGASGCGKTTLIRMINGLIPHYFEGSMSGRLLLNGRDVNTFESWEYGQSVGSVFQDTRSQFFTSHVIDELAFAAENYGIEPSIIQERITQVLKRNQIEALRHASLMTLSSGEKQKVAMSAVEVHQPSILVLDEPSANLDQSACLHLAEQIKDLKASGHTVIIADHRLYYLMDAVDRVILIADQEIAQDWSIAQFSQLSKAMLQAYGLRDFQPVLINDLTHQQPVHLKDQQALLDVEELSVSFHKRAEPLLKPVNLQLRQGEIVIVSGENGIGKTTFARTLCGINPALHGTIRIDQRPVNEKQRQHRFWYVLQDSDYQLFSDSVLHELLLGFKASDTLVERAEQLLWDLDLHLYKDRHPASLSGGQKQRLTFAVGLMRHPEILILDEPTSGLDAANMTRMVDLIHAYADQGIGFIIISHDFEFARQLKSRVLLLQPRISD